MVSFKCPTPYTTYLTASWLHWQMGSDSLTLSVPVKLPVKHAFQIPAFNTLTAVVNMVAREAVDVPQQGKTEVIERPHQPSNTNPLNPATDSQYPDRNHHAVERPLTCV